MSSRMCVRCGEHRAKFCDTCEPQSPPWTPFVPGTVPPPDSSPLVRAVFEGCDVFVNSRYQVVKRFLGEGPLGKGWHLSVKRTDCGPLRDWRDLQRIKNELCGSEMEGVEMFPAESRLIDGSNQYHLWVFESRLPFGFDEGRSVTETPFPGGRQRPFEVKPPDLLSRQEIAEKIRSVFNA